MVAKLAQRSREFYKGTMQLNVYENHLSVTVDFEQYCGVYQCIHCNKLCNDSCHYYRQIKICTTMVREVFPGAIHKNPATIFEKSEEIRIAVPIVTVNFRFSLTMILKHIFPKNKFLTVPC